MFVYQQDIIYTILRTNSLIYMNVLPVPATYVFYFLVLPRIACP